MVYSTRYFFRLAGLLLAAYVLYAYFPDILEYASGGWEQGVRLVLRMVSRAD
jgi:hypothetical protein